MSNALTEQSTEERRSRKRGVVNYSPECFLQTAKYKPFAKRLFFILFVSPLFILSNYKVTQEIESFSSVERFAVENLFLLVINAAKIAIK